MDRVDVTIIGAGVIGLAVSYLLSKEGKDIVVAEKHNSFGQETSSRNSEVIHAGLYYQPGSLKAETCICGKELLYGLCEEQNIPYQRIGKLVVGSDPIEISKIENIYKNANDCGISDLTYLESSDIRKLEPNVSSKMGIWSPSTGIIDSHSLMKFFYEFSKERSAEYAFGVEVVGIEYKGSHYEITVKEPSEETFSFESEKVINAAGFSSDKIASLVGLDVDKLNYRIKLSKGQYFRISNPKKFNISHLIYPPPSNIDLGIHVTPDLAGGLRLGPDSAYVDDVDYRISDASKDSFFTSVSRYLEGLSIDDLVPDTAGIRAKLQDKDEAFRDFVIADEAKNGFPGFINLIGIESPGLTASLSIAARVSNFC